MSQLIARRYAKALIAAATQAHDLESVESDLNVLSKAYQQPDLRQFFENPVFQKSERLEFIQKLELSERTKRCLELMIERNRTLMLPDLARAYTRELDTKLGRVRARITTAKELTPEQLSHITGALFKRLGKEVIPEVDVSAQVLGGVRAQIGGLVFDNTLQTQFSQLRRDLCN